MEQIPVSSSSWEKGKLEHIFLTVRFKKLKPMAAPLRVSLLFATFFTFEVYPEGFSVPDNFCVAFA